MVEHSSGKARLYIGDPRQTMQKGAVFDLAEASSHYLSRVMRCQAGDKVLLFNGRDGEWLAEITQCSKKTVSVSLLARTREQTPVPDFWLVFAPIKSGRIDYMAEKATELGVRALYPVKTDHTVMSRVNIERLQAHCVEAAEQTERMDVPVVHDYQPLHDFLSHWPEERTLLFADETGGGDEATRQRMLEPGAYGLLIGPEGGFSQRELEHLRRLPFARGISLGPRVLRADTAALAALTYLQLAAGDWDQSPAWRTRNMEEVVHGTGTA